MIVLVCIVNARRAVRLLLILKSFFARGIRDQTYDKDDNQEMKYLILNYILNEDM